MCLQCVVESETFGEIVSGWFFQRARKHDEDWPAGWWGLVRCNDPEIVWEGEIVADPLAHLSDDEYDAYDGPNVDDEFNRAAWEFEGALKLSPEDGEHLVNAAREAGWNRERQRLAHWLMNRMAEAVAKGPVG